MTREQILKHPAYWFEHEQNELFRQVSDYMEREKINRTELAKRLNVSKGYISQILNGNFNYTLKKWIELCLAIGIVPSGYKRIEDVIKEDAILKSYYDEDISILTNNVIPLYANTDLKEPEVFDDYRGLIDSFPPNNEFFNSTQIYQEDSIVQLA